MSARGRAAGDDGRQAELMATLGFVRLSKSSVGKVKKFLNNLYDLKSINLCRHPRVIAECRGTDLSRETQLYNEMVLWLRYHEKLTARRPGHLPLLTRIRQDYDKLSGFVAARPELCGFDGLTEVNVFDDAVYGDDYVPRVDVFLRGLEDLARCLCAQGPDKPARAVMMGFINMRAEEVNRLMDNVRDAAERVLVYELLDVRDPLNEDPSVLVHNRLVYLCRLAYAISKSWQTLSHMCLDRINSLRRRLILAFHDRPAFARVYARNALERPVDGTTAYNLLRRLEEDFLLFRNALRWGDPDWGLESELESEGDNSDAGSDLDLEDEDDDDDDGGGPGGHDDDESGGNRTPDPGMSLHDDTGSGANTCLIGGDDDNCGGGSGRCLEFDPDSERCLGVKMVNGRALRWWNPTGIMVDNEAAVWIDEHGRVMAKPPPKELRKASSDDGGNKKNPPPKKNVTPPVSGSNSVGGGVQTPSTASGKRTGKKKEGGGGYLLRSRSTDDDEVRKMKKDGTIDDRADRELKMALQKARESTADSDLSTILPRTEPLRKVAFVGDPVAAFGDTVRTSSSSSKGFDDGPFTTQGASVLLPPPLGGPGSTLTLPPDLPDLSGVLADEDVQDSRYGKIPKSRTKKHPTFPENYKQRPPHNKDDEYYWDETGDNMPVGEDGGGVLEDLRKGLEGIDLKTGGGGSLQPPLSQQFAGSPFAGSDGDGGGLVKKSSSH
ncbi:M32 protein [Murid betaherpesvirus 1]|nr:M32 protein [Murid betaherpesvirus 1]